MTSAHVLPHAPQRYSVRIRVPCCNILSTTEMFASLQSGQMTGVRVIAAKGSRQHVETEGVYVEAAEESLG